MSVPTLSRRQLAVAATVIATLAAGLPALMTSPAWAAPTSGIALSGPSRGAAGSCLTYTVTPSDDRGRPITDTGTIVVRLTESPNTATQDVDFCTPSSTPSTAPHYVNANGATRTYTAGTTITSATTASSNPDVASTTSPAAQANPSGRDTAVFIYNGSTGGNTTITFGVVALQPGGATIDVFRSVDGDETQSPGDLSRSQTVAFTDGGLPDSNEAVDAVRTVTLTPEDSFSPTGGAAHTFTAVLSNSSGDGVTGVQPSIRATNGPNTTAPPTWTASCTVSNNVGTSTCTYRGTRSGTDTVIVWVDQTSARTAPATPTPGVDQNEPRDTSTATQTVTAAQAKVIDLTPATSSNTSGTSRVLTAQVTDANGTPTPGVGVSFTETGPGNIQGGTAGSGTTSTLNGTTDAAGRASVTITSTVTATGTSTVTVAIRTPGGTQCQTSGGRCSDSSTVTFAGASPSPSPSPTASPTGTPGCTTASTLLSTGTIRAMETANVTVSAARGSTVDLFAYTRPLTTYTIVRSGVVTSNGTITWGIRPPRNTRLFAQQRGCAPGNQVVLGVRTTLSLAAFRNGTRNYTFSGDSLPARPGGLIVTLYRINPDGSEVITAQVRASETTGEWSLTRQFTGTGRFGFVVHTGQDLQNAPGFSNVRPTLIY